MENYDKALIEYFTPHYDELCPDCQNRLEKNPKRLLDCKVKTCKEIAKDTPNLLNYLNEEDAEHFEEVQKYLNLMGVPFEINPKIVRGLDYYTNTVFEFLNDNLGAQNAIIAGILVSFASGIIGSLIVVNRMVFLAGGIAHTSYGGIGIAVYFGLPIFFGASVFALFSALLMAFITINQKDKIDIFIGLIWSVGMAVGILLIDLTDGYNVDLMSYLFGSILAVSENDINFIFYLIEL